MPELCHLHLAEKGQERHVPTLRRIHKNTRLRKFKARATTSCRNKNPKPIRKLDHRRQSARDPVAITDKQVRKAVIKILLFLGGIHPNPGPPRTHQGLATFNVRGPLITTIRWAEIMVAISPAKLSVIVFTEWHPASPMRQYEAVARLHSYFITQLTRGIAVATSTANHGCPPVATEILSGRLASFHAKPMPELSLEITAYYGSNVGRDRKIIDAHLKGIPGGIIIGDFNATTQASDTTGMSRPPCVENIAGA
eukprot:TRINITY_DN8563_c0_g1_i1.p1 TRINITY_DN8563_c0_g1~~TRINITY_DN8563_c0_g1_i1.p1  ORF type:complete len:253 (-),score=4.60 TRINITY_DN8563_c0_g1_i1:222-980(-)